MRKRINASTHFRLPYCLIQMAEQIFFVRAADMLPGQNFIRVKLSLCSGLDIHSEFVKGPHYLYFCSCIQMRDVVCLTLYHHLKICQGVELNHLKIYTKQGSQILFMGACEDGFDDETETWG